MKKFKLLSLIGIISLALAQAGWAGGHGGGGGGHGGGGGGHGGGFGGGGFHGGGFRGGGFRGVVSTVVVSVGDVSAVVVSTAVAFVGAVSAVVVSTTVAFVVAVLMGATSAITDSLMMSSSAASDFRGGGAGTIPTDITVTAITLTVTIDTVGTRTAMDTAVTVTKVAPVMDIAMEAERVMDMAMAVEAVTGTAMVADQAISGVRGVGDRPGYGSLKYRRPVGVWRSNCK